MKFNGDEIIKNKLRIMSLVKKFKEEIALHGHKNTEKELKFSKKVIKFFIELADDEDQDNIDYLIDRHIYFDDLFHDYFIKNNNTDEVSEESTINNSTFIETPEWIKNKKCTINPQNRDNKCFQYSVIAALNYQNIKSNPERTS